MATHPVESEEDASGHEPATPNPTHLPVEPEFAPDALPTEPEDPGAAAPNLP